MSHYKPLKDVLPNAPHYVALGQSTVYLDQNDPDLPWQDVLTVVAGGAYRLNGPSGIYCVAERDGLTLKWPVDFEAREANGKGYSLFDRDRLRLVMQKLPPKARKEFANFLEDEVLPGVNKVSSEYREYLNKQLDSEDCVRGLIAFARVG